MAANSDSPVELEDVQGIVAKGYDRLHSAAYVLLSFGDPAESRSWIGELAGRVTPASVPSEQATPTAMHVALTHPGLRTLGLGSDGLGSFSREFQEGMTPPERSRLLGDRNGTGPEHWIWGGPNNEVVHLVLMIYALDESHLEEKLATEREKWGRSGLSEVKILPTTTLLERKEHFGFHDGITQPLIAGVGRSLGDTKEKPTATGEFILGYANEYGRIPESPRVSARSDARGVLPDAESKDLRDLGRNGSYLVFRQLSQDVAGFWNSVSELSRSGEGELDPERAVWLASKMVGRWPNGAPLTRFPDAEPASTSEEERNDFLYNEIDPHGDGCPVGAHIRRTNPRDSLKPSAEKSLMMTRRHRLLRRGRSYGPPLTETLDARDLIEASDDGQQRGLHFICFNSDISRQFEFVQDTWVNDPKFGGLSADPDPLAAYHSDPTLPGTRPEDISRFTVQQCPVRHRVVGLPPFVKVLGGAYFFLPSIRALRYLGSLE